MVKLMPLSDVSPETKALIGIDAARVLCGIKSILADRNATSSVISIYSIMRRTRFGAEGVETGQSLLHKHGLIDIELESWDIVSPEKSRFLYTLPGQNPNND